MRTKKEFWEEQLSKPVHGMGVTLDLLNKDYTGVPISIFGTEHILDDTVYDTANEEDLAAYFEALKKLGIDDPDKEIKAAIAEGEGPWQWTDSGDRYIEDENRLYDIISRKLRKGFRRDFPQFSTVQSFKEGMPYYLENAIGWRNAEGAKYNDDGSVEFDAPVADGKPFHFKYQANIKPAAEDKAADYMKNILAGLHSLDFKQDD